MEIKDQVINITYSPFYGMFEIKREDIAFSVVEHMYKGDNSGFGLQLGNESKREEIFKKSVEIFKLTKELAKLLEE